jgi:MoxR-like ATPase
VLTSNGERDFPPPFLRRCIRFTMPPLTVAALVEIVEAHELALNDSSTRVLTDFAERINRGEHLAIDQLLNAIHLLGGDLGPTERQGERLTALLLQELGRG